ncbi:MAG TPA: hypothetical protein VGO69_00585 [Pyrinomonadaceae bacterium]|nr:hypothetical protein [Pyrinomonadaceae bacterium]
MNGETMNEQLNLVMQKYNCRTLEELEEKPQELQHHFEVTRSMVDHAIRVNDLEHANRVGALMDAYAAQAHEIEDALNAEKLL